MTFQTLDYIIAIAEEKSISKAADRLLLSQPALSRQLKRVEESLDTKLFAREQNEMRLTDAGKIYVNGARSIQNIYERALNDIRKLSQSGRHQITFIYNNILLPDFSTEILPDFRKLHPDTVLSTINGNASVAKDYLSNGMADLAVVATGEAGHSMLEFLPLCEEELMLAIPEKHPVIPDFEQYGADLSMLSGEPFILNQHNSFFTALNKTFWPDFLFCRTFCARSVISTHPETWLQTEKVLPFSRALPVDSSMAAGSFSSSHGLPFRLPFPIPKAML